VNEFLEQFVLESRELIDQASDGLLILEQSPSDAERLDAVFRAFHTLKGGAGIVEFPAMERSMHAAENVLTDARSGKRALTPDLVGNCLWCLDQALQWLDLAEQTGELPVIDDEQVNNLISRLDTASRVAPNENMATVNGVTQQWVTEILARSTAARAKATVAVQYVPDAGCFYQSEDPLQRMTSLPGLLALELEPVSAWPTLDTLDPFACNLVLTALTAASLQDVSAHMRGYSGSCEMLSVASGTTLTSDSSLPRRAREILEAQIALLGEGKPGSIAGHVASAGLTAANVLKFCRRSDQAEALARATEQSLQQNTSRALHDALTAALIAPQSSASQAVAASAPQHADVAPRTLRVDTARIDALVRLTGELTVAKNSIGHIANLARDGAESVAAALKTQHDVLERLVVELQRSVLGMRVLPLRTVLQRFPRVLRDMATHLAKPVELKIEGEETEADKAIVEMLFEPLLHIVRNALDHGVESPAERRLQGKPAVAMLRIRAARQADRVLIDISDDGRGIDVQRVREVATERGVITEEVARLMTDTEVVDLVFAPGFSTASKVTELSGRGVGMDAVRTAVERVGGRVSIESRAGSGTTVKLSLPFSVMMTNVMTVEAGEQMFGIPLDVVVETVRVPRQAIAAVGGGLAIVLRDRTLPVFELAQILGVSQATDTKPEAILVVAAFAGQFGAIRVDRLCERMAVMLEPLAGLLAGTPGIAGTTLLGDGRVLLVLDIAEMLQ
jgi:two-component system, chemotaxis family, sensor kinase CheA